MDETPMLTIAEAAELMRCDWSYVAMLIDSNQLPGAIVTKFGQRKVPQSAIINWLDQSRMPVDPRKLPYPQDLLELVAGMRSETASEVLASFERHLLSVREELKNLPDGRLIMDMFTDEQLKEMAEAWKAFENKQAGNQSPLHSSGKGSQPSNRRYRRYIILPKRAEEK